MATQVLRDTSEWIETDPDSKLTVDETSVVSNLITSDYAGWVVKDFGADHFDGDFEFLLSTEAIWSSGTHTATVISIQNSATGTPLGIEVAAGDTINVRWQNTGSSTTGIRIRDDAASQDISINLGAESVRKYIKFYRDETIGTYGRAYCDIYSDADFATLVDPTYIDLSAKKDFRYINFGGGWHTGQTAVGALSNFNLDIQEALISESGSAHNSGTTTTTITTGTHGLTINEGDFVVFYANRAESGANITDNNGSTPLTEDYQADLDAYRYAIFSRTAGASEPTSYNFTVDSASSTLWVCHIRVFPGAEWDVAPSGATVSTGTTSTATAPTATVSDNSLGLVIVAQDTTSNCKNPTNGYGHELEKLVWNCLASYTKDFPSAGATGATSVTLDFSGDWAAHQVSLKPVAAGGSPAIVGAVTHTLTPAAVMDFTKHAAIVGALSHIYSPAAVISKASHHTMVGDVTHTLSPSAVMNKRQYLTIIGTSSIALTNAAVMVFVSSYIIIGSILFVLSLATVLDKQQHPTLVGNVPTTVSITATLAKQQHPTIVGNVPITVSIAATLDKQQHSNIVGNIPTIVLITATLDKQQHSTIVGSVSVVITSATIMSFEGVYTLIGNVPIITSVVATLDKQQHPSILGNIPVVITSATIMSFNNVYTLIGNIPIIVTSAAILDFVQHYSIIGTQIISSTSAALLTFITNFSIIGSNSVIITADTILDYQLHPSIIGDLIVIITPAAILIGPTLPITFPQTIWRIINVPIEFRVININEENRFIKI